MRKPASPSVPPVPPTPQQKRRAATRRLFLRLCGAATTVAVAAPVEARYIEPFAVEMTKHDAFLPHLPLDLDGMVVAHLTDVHRGPITPDAVIQQAIARTVAANPDLIIHTGDFVASHPDDATAFAKMLQPLAPRFGSWGCLGNHDYAIDADAIAKAMEAGGVWMLRNTSAQAVNGLWLAGIEDTLRGRPDAKAALASVKQDAALLFLTHNPVGIWGASGRKCVAFAGHTHGGQILIPGLPTPMPPGMDGFPLVAGWGVFDQAGLYVSRGVGMGMAPLRFRCRPEVALVTLHRGEAAPFTRPGLAGRAARKAVRVAKRAYHALHDAR